MPKNIQERSEAFNADRTRIDDCECPQCRSALKLSTLPDPQQIIRGGIVCTGCGAGYDLIWGAPFLGAFESDDILGLFEIAANARSDSHYPNASTIRRIDALLAAYHSALDRIAFIENNPDEFVRAPWFRNRYCEWLHFTELAAGLSFEGLNVLDVGAGTGFDSFRLAAAGARVTALEYNPMLVRRGMGVVPAARWIGGFAHVLPFASGTFDAVCCNAALHHMRDVSGALTEMLRVLKPGGWLITTGDPYRSRDSSIATEFAVFNWHPAVLLGINESVPSFTSFETVLSRYRTKLETQLLTTDLHHARLPRTTRRNIIAFLRRRRPIITNTAAKHADIADLHFWDFDVHRRMLGDASGSIGIRCRLMEPMDISPRQQKDIVITASDFAETLSDYHTAIQRLAALLPSHQIDRPFPGTEQTKFELLNGWQAPDGSEARTAYKCARWFLRRPTQANALLFDQRQVAARRRTSANMNVLINGRDVTHATLKEMSWSLITVPLHGVGTQQIFVCEMQHSPSLRLLLPLSSKSCSRYAVAVMSDRIGVDATFPGILLQRRLVLLDAAVPGTIVLLCARQLHEVI